MRNIAQNTVQMLKMQYLHWIDAILVWQANRSEKTVCEMMAVGVAGRPTVSPPHFLGECSILVLWFKSDFKKPITMQPFKISRGSPTNTIKCTRVRAANYYCLSCLTNCLLY